MSRNKPYWGDQTPVQRRKNTGEPAQTKKEEGDCRFYNAAVAIHTDILHKLVEKSEATKHHLLTIENQIYALDQRVCQLEEEFGGHTSPSNGSDLGRQQSVGDNDSGNESIGPEDP